MATTYTPTAAVLAEREWWLEHKPLLSQISNQRHRRAVEERYGLESGTMKSLSEVARTFETKPLSVERIRQFIFQAKKAVHAREEAGVDDGLAPPESASGFKAPPGKWLVRLGCHRGTMMTRDSDRREFDTEQEAREDWDRTEQFWSETGLLVWYAHLYDDQGNCQQLAESAPYF